MSNRISNLKQTLNSLPEKPKSLPFPLREEETEAFLFRLTKKYPGCFLLESHPGYPDNYRYSILGFSPFVQFRGYPGKLIIDGETFSVSNPYRTLQEIFPPKKNCKRYTGGLVGYLGYDSASLFEPVTALNPREGYPLFSFGLYLDGIVIDHLTGTSEYFYYTRSRIEELNVLLDSDDSIPRDTKVRSFGFSKTKEEYSNLFLKTKEEILSGNTFQCQIGFEEEFEIEGSLVPIYGNLKKGNPSPYLFFYKDGEIETFGSSPELLFSHKDRIAETYPLAGTYPRGATPEEDRILARKLLSDEKEIAEHSMLIDLHRNDLSRVCESGTVRLKKEFEILKFAHVQHITSEVSGILKKDEDSFSGLASVFPAGTLTGAPKVESIKLISKTEGDDRGLYGGVLGYFSLDGSSQFCILIRSLFRSGNSAYSRGASGIVFDSQEELEYQEILNKLKAVKRSMEEFTV
ncbi:anthranilate synthase component I family protein [Leptospira yasudae]|uniref:Anthranilate synthase component I n=1 Tax=Leptospira yasudae TaxID=2202201 RepID=A0ABX9M1X6_9LEPT|nr:anthranilate synthase component I [Leptospira yasudae]TGK31607.1 anthranilate synthase component I family protein [Leptospira yasudae]TGM03305.1 anthranilate synthase component I family protein [Leptospira yasudae]